MSIDSTSAIPAGLNLVLLPSAIVAAAASLWLASHTQNLWLMLAAAIAFSFVNNTMFSLLHEAVHGIFHPDKRVNAAAGRITACFFPTSYSIQRAFHLTHHRYNRTPDEQFDLIRPGDNRVRGFFLCLRFGPGGDKVCYVFHVGKRRPMGIGAASENRRFQQTFPCTDSDPSRDSGKNCAKRSICFVGL